MDGVPGFWQIDTGDEAYVYRDGNFQLWASILYPAPGEIPYFGEVYAVDESTGSAPVVRGFGVLTHPLVFAREDPDQYQTACLTTLRPGVDVELMCAIGLAGEVGEVCEPIKKHRFHGKPLGLPEMRKEIGDVLWYLAVLAKHYGFSLSSIMTENIRKLQKRQQELDALRPSGDTVAGEPYDPRDGIPQPTPDPTTPGDAAHSQDAQDP